MSNIFFNNPIVIDTPMTVEAMIGHQLNVYKVVWNNPTAVGQSFSIMQSNSYPLLMGTCAVANQSQQWDFNTALAFPPGGLGEVDWSVGSLTGGTLLIYHSES